MSVLRAARAGDPFQGSCKTENDPLSGTTISWCPTQPDVGFYSGAQHVTARGRSEGGAGAVRGF